MPPSERDEPLEQPSSIPGQPLAIAAECLYLINLLLLPGVAFVILLIVYFKTIGEASSLAACHLRQALAASLWAGAILVAANIIMVMWGGIDAASTWVIVILYFTCCHSTLVLFGIIGLAKAMAGKPYRYPLIGRPCEPV